MSARRRVAVVGGGVAGLSVAWFLAAEEDVEVTLVEREPRHDAHSTGRSAEILRTAVGDPVTRALARDAAALLAEPRRAGLEGVAPLVDGTGLVVATREDDRSDWIAESREHGTGAALEPDAYARLCPHFRPAGTALHRFAGGGGIDGARLVRTLAAGAMARGARFVRSRGVTAVRLADGRATGLVLEGGGSLSFDDVVLSAGAWTRTLGAAAGAPLPLRPTRRHLLRYAPDALPGAPDAPPTVWDDAADTYLRRLSDGRWLFSVCDQTDAGDVDGADRYRVDPDVVARARGAFERHTGSGARPQLAWAGFRDLSPDDRPILGPDPRVPGLHWCAGAGGHGFTLSLGVGRAAAACVLGQATPHATSCSARRFL
ncbi:MAG: FAD-dependent oxidoreductase [Planctomycetota bacterium]